MLWKNQSKQIDLPLAGGATGRILKSEPEALLVSAHSREAMIKVSQWARASGRDLNELLCLQIVITAVWHLTGREISLWEAGSHLWNPEILSIVQAGTENQSLCYD